MDSMDELRITMSENADTASDLIIAGCEFSLYCK
jgi:hypothetical protein